MSDCFEQRKLVLGNKALLHEQRNLVLGNKTLLHEQSKVMQLDKGMNKGFDVKSFNVLCVTNRGLCKDDFLVRIRKIASTKSAGIILREKDMKEEEYKKLASRVIKICNDYGTTCILHSFVNVAKELDCKSIHLPLSILKTLSLEDKAKFAMIGASCHSIDEALEAERLGCNYIIAGHIFDTDCKKGLPGRGVEFLHLVCEQVSIPVYAIGGISRGNIAQVKSAGAYGACVMSGVMVCEDVEKYLENTLQ